MPGPTQPIIQRLDSWKHGPAVLKLFAEDFGDEETVDIAATDDFAPVGLVEIDDSVGFVWVEDDEVLGAIICLPNLGRKDTWIIANLVTNARFRRRGIGQALLDAAIQFITTQGATYAALQVDKKNTSAISLYRRVGFEVISEMVHYAMTPKTMLATAKRVEVRLAEPNDADVIWRLATASYPESLGFAEPLDLEGFRLKPPKFWQRKTADTPKVYVAAALPITGAVLVREELLDGMRRRFELRPVFGVRLSAADGAGLVVGVLRVLALEAMDEVNAMVSSSTLVNQLGLEKVSFRRTRSLLNMCKSSLVS